MKQSLLFRSFDKVGSYPRSPQLIPVRFGDKRSKARIICVFIRNCPVGIEEKFKDRLYKLLSSSSEKIECLISDLC